MLIKTALNHAEIAARIPHSGNMCLLDTVLEWDTEYIVCRASSHRDPANPLRAEGRLAAVCGIEYAAQAMAVHGSLRAEALAANATMPRRPRSGYLATMRKLALHAAWLDQQVDDLRITAIHESGDARLVAYAFTVHAGEILLLEGRATVVLDADNLAGQRMITPSSSL